MKKRDIIAAVAAQTGLTKTAVEGVLTALSDCAAVGISNTGEFVLPGIVRLKVQHRSERQGRNPATGETITIPAKSVLKAKPDKALADCA